MVRTGEDPVRVSVPVFSYIEKREALQNAEVFCDFFRQVPAEMRVIYSVEAEVMIVQVMRVTPHDYRKR